MKKALSLLVLLTVLDNLVFGQETFSVVAPNRAANEEGNGASFPFCCGRAIRQLLYDESNFVETMPNGGIIREVAFRIDGPQGQQEDILIPEIEIYMFTTPQRVKDVNVTEFLPPGSDRTLVFRRGPLRMSSSWSAEWPNPFELEIPLSQPFRYCPWAGTLVVEIHQYTEGSGALLDIQGDPSVRLLSGRGFDVPPVTQFTFSTAGDACLRISIQREDEGIRLTSSNGGIVEKTDSLKNEVWVTIGSAPQLHAITNQTLFFRVRKDEI